ncbi:endonuclease/exonuclease/phosphatase family protein [Pontiella sp.]|uniref:endonuclease/exonuclease/phosphatase family protein n=1 Tax=Pontiella sp. TaxID=2837462 RepID=UPI003561C4BF
MKLSLRGMLDAFGMGLLVATVLGFLGRLFWLFDLFSHFRVQYMQLCLVLIGIALWKRWNQRAVALVLLAVFNYAFVLPLYFGKPASALGQPTRAMLMNINALNGNTEQVLKAISAADPDVLLLEEVTTKWERQFETLRAQYPHRIAQARDDCFGIMLLSKLPLSRGEILSVGEANLPTIVATIHTPSGEVSFIGTHPLPPIGKSYSRLRNEQLQALPALIAAQKHPVLLIGDLNTSPWSPHFKQLVKESGLKNSMKGFGFQPTWPANRSFLRIPLDHALHAAQIAVHHRMVGGDVGSDHFPVIVDFSVGRK